MPEWHLPQGPVSPIGRVGERAHLARFLTLPEPPSRALLVCGEPGLGKTTLLLSVADEAAATGSLVAVSRPSEDERRSAYLVLADLLDALDPIVGGESLTRAQTTALELIRTGETDRLSTTWRGVAAAFLAIIRAHAQQRQVILAIDDLPWADPASLRVVTHALRRAPAQVRLIATQRLTLGSRFVAEAPSLTGLDPLVWLLPPMADRELEDVLRERCPWLGPGQARGLSRSSMANPLVALELARAATETSGERPVLPPRLHDLTRQRLGTLGPVGLAVTRWASVLSRPTTAALEHAMGAAETTQQGLREAERAGILELWGQRWAFTHPLYLASASADLPSDGLRALHARAAELTSDLEERAWHLSLAATAADADVAEQLAEAARHRLAAGAPDAAADLLGAALRLTDPEDVESHAVLECRLAEVLLRLDRLDEVVEIASRVAGGGSSDDTRARAMQAWARAAADLTGPGDQIRTLEKALRLDLDPRRAMGVCEQLLLRLVDVGRGDEIEAVLGRIEGFASTAHDLDLVSRATSQRVLFDFQRGLVTAQAALDRLGVLDQEVALVEDATTNIAIWAARVDLTEAGWGGILSDVRGSGDVVTESEVLQSRTDLDLRLGNLSRAADTLAMELSGSDALDQHRDAFTHDLSARLQLLRGDLDGARSAASRALELAGDASWLLARGQAALGLADLLDDSPTKAAEHLERVARVDPVLMRWRHGMCFVGVDRVEALALAGEVELAVLAVKALVEQADVWGDPWALAAAARSRAHVAAVTGDLDDAWESATIAVERYSDLPFRPDLGRALLLAGRLARRRGRLREARRLLGTAREVFDEMGATGWSRAVDRELARIGGRAPSPGELTASEIAVAELVVEGLSNRAVAARLSVSVRTVESHLTRIYAKTGVSSRTGLAATFRHP